MTNEYYTRQYVANLYDQLGWKTRVANMSDDQVTAIYLRVLRDGVPAEIIESENQLRLF